MRVHNVERDVTVTGVESTNKFKIAMNAKMFEMLSKKLYERPVEAVLREIGANAYDANRAAGKGDEPIRVFMPTRLQPVLKVRDNGIGMSHEFVMENYTTYGESTKDDSNDAIGGFGLGCKSPFAITDTFTVISRYEGMQRSYTAVIGANGEPDINLLAEQETDECNGVEVIIPCSSDMVRDFHDVAPKIFEHYAVRPDFKNFESREIDTRKEKILFENDDLILFKNERYYRESDIRILMGVVAYPISLSDITDLDGDVKKFIENLRMTLKFDIGDVEIAPSRERLNYDKESIARIRERLVEARDAIMEHYFGDIIRQPDHYDACCDFVKVRRHLPFVPSEYKIGGRVLSTTARYDRSRFAKKDNIYFTKAASHEFGDRMPGRSHQSDGFSFEYNKNVLFVIDDVVRCYARSERIRRRASEGGFNSVIVVQSRNMNNNNVDTIKRDLENQLKKIFEKIGVPDYEQLCYLSETPEIERPTYAGWRTSVGGIRVATTDWRKNPFGVHRNQDVLHATIEPKTDEDDNLILETEALYVEMSRGKPEITGSDIYKIISTDPRPLYFVPKTFIRKIPDTWKPVVEVVDEKVKHVRVASYIKQRELHDCYELSHGFLTNLMDSEFSNCRELMEKFIEELPSHPLSQLISLYERGKKFKHDAYISSVIDYAHIDRRRKISNRVDNQITRLMNDLKNEFLLYNTLTANRVTGNNYRRLVDEVVKAVYNVTV